MTISEVEEIKKQRKEIYCSYCGAKLTSEDLFCSFCRTKILSFKTESQEEKMQGLKKIAREILSIKKVVEEARTQLATKEEEFRDVEFENARRSAATPPETEVDITFIQTEIADMTASLDAKRDYLLLLIEKAQRVYPKYFKK